MVRLALLAALAAAETFDFVHEHWTEIVAPANGERFGAGAALAVVAELRSASLPAVRNATVVSLPLRVATSERLYSFGVGEAPADAAAPGRVAAFCAAVGLEPANCAKVTRVVASLAAHVAAPAPAPRVCVALQRGGDAAREVCADGGRATLAAAAAARARARELGLRAAVAAAIAARPRLITAVSERYVAEGILGNLVGSLHFWEPGEVLDVYDLGLSPAARADVAAMADVRLLPLAPAAALGATASPSPSATCRRTCSTRRPTRSRPPSSPTPSRPTARRCGSTRTRSSGGPWTRSGASSRSAATSSSSTPTASRRPSSTTRRPSRASAAPRRTSPASTARRRSSAPRRGWLARDVLPRLVDCVADPDCVNPPGSSRANHRQEQTALNAILCARDYDPDGACHGDTRFRMTSDFENDADPVQPTADETDWNDVVFYTRRNHALKPYRRFLRRRARGE
ncbi:hypothetical protein JL722_3518 [Aureococcus anophagefferens]|nr:hypothetical protein JL722_3518 [Aureococcus anophagefferens]